MTDTHTHIYDRKAFGEGPCEVLERARKAGVSRFVLPNVNPDSVEPLSSLHKAFPDCTYVAAGLHPCDATENWHGQLDSIMKGLRNCNPVAIGEVGIDLHWDKSTFKRQKEVFERQIDIASELRLPLIIHCREALPETLDILSGRGSGIAAVFHSFTGTADDVRLIREAGDYYFGINGVVTFKNAPGLREALPEIGLDRILLETDSPYLAPVPHRGRRNESAYVVDICRAVGAAMGIDAREVEKVTDINASALFGI